MGTQESENDSPVLERQLLPNLGRNNREPLPVNEMSLSNLAKCSAHEMEKSRRKETHNDQYFIEILRRAVIAQDNDAWSVLYQQLSRNVWTWIRNHPQREMALRHQSEQSYVDAAFTRFWRAMSDQKQGFSALAEALRYLYLCLNSTIMDTLRAYSRPMEEPLPDLGHPLEPKTEDCYMEDELWRVIKGILPSEKEQRMAYLHFHCNLKPREIVYHYPNDFGSEAEVYRLRRNIMHRVLRNTDKLRWQLGGSQER